MIEELRFSISWEGHSNLDRVGFSRSDLLVDVWLDCHGYPNRVCCEHGCFELCRLLCQCRTVWLSIPFLWYFPSQTWTHSPSSPINLSTVLSQEHSILTLL